MVAEKGKKNGKAFVSKEEGERDRRNIRVGKLQAEKITWINRIKKFIRRQNDLSWLAVVFFCRRDDGQDNVKFVYAQ